MIDIKMRRRSQLKLTVFDLARKHTNENLISSGLQVALSVSVIKKGNAAVLVWRFYSTKSATDCFTVHFVHLQNTGNRAMQKNRPIFESNVWLRLLSFFRRDFAACIRRNTVSKRIVQFHHELIQLQ